MQSDCFLIHYDRQAVEQSPLPHHRIDLVWEKLPSNLPMSTHLHHVQSRHYIRSWISYDPYPPLHIWDMHTMHCTWGNFHIVLIPWRGNPKYWILLFVFQSTLLLGCFFVSPFEYGLIVLCFNLPLIPPKQSCGYNVCLASIRQTAITFERKYVNSINFILVSKADPFLFTRRLLFPSPSTIVDI